VFGQVTEGMHAVRLIEAAGTSDGSTASKVLITSSGQVGMVPAPAKGSKYVAPSAKPRTANIQADVSIDPAEAQTDVDAPQQDGARVVCCIRPGMFLRRKASRSTDLDVRL
jgi:hypothetical protein